MGLALLVRDINGTEVYREKIGDYMGFHRFRVAWAALLSLDLDKMDGYGGRETWEQGPLQCFFDHSDCEGTISWSEARSILQRARKDAAKLPAYSCEFEILISACKEAVKHQTPIVFC